MKPLGVERILSLSAVGSLKEEYTPLDIVIPDQFFDRTRRGAPPSSARARGARRLRRSGVSALCAADAAGLRRGRRAPPRGGTYLCIEGPQFSTKAESQLYRSWGMDVIGMTNLQEAKLAREAEICYATLAMVTDYDCWHPEHDAVTVDSVIAVLGKNVATARKVVRAAVRRLPKPRKCKCGTRCARS